MTNTHDEIVGIEKFQRDVLLLCKGDKEKAEIMKKYVDLEMDFEYIKDLNTQLSAKYQELMECFPTAKELDKIIHFVNENIEQHEIAKRADELEYSKERLIKLTKFKSALVALEKQDPSVKPIKYDDLMKDEPKEDIKLIEYKPKK